MCVFQRCEFERQKASCLKSDFLSFSPVKKTSQWNRRESTALSDLRTHTNTHTAHTRIMFTALIWHYNAAVCVCAGAAAAPEQLSLSPCATPSSEESEVTPGSRQNMVMTPNTPELYSALKLRYYRSNIWHCTSCTTHVTAQLDSTVLFSVSCQNGSFSHPMTATWTGPFRLQTFFLWRISVFKDTFKKKKKKN